MASLMKYYWRDRRNPFSLWHISHVEECPKEGESLAAICGPSPPAIRDNLYERLGEFEKMGVKGWACHHCYQKLSVEDKGIHGYCPCGLSLPASGKCSCTDQYWWRQSPVQQG